MLTHSQISLSNEPQAKKTYGLHVAKTRYVSKCTLQTSKKYNAYTATENSSAMSTNLSETLQSSPVLKQASTTISHPAQGRRRYCSCCSQSTGLVLILGRSMTSITPLAVGFCALQMSDKQATTPKPRSNNHYDSPEAFASDLRPMCLNLTQRRVRMMRAFPFWATCPSLMAFLKVRPFPIRSRKSNSPLHFEDIVADERRQTQMAPSQERRLLSDPAFITAVRQYKVGKAPNTRRYRRSLPSLNALQREQPRASFTAPKPTRAFDEEAEDDPFMLFPEWYVSSRSFSVVSNAHTVVVIGVSLFHR